MAQQVVVIEPDYFSVEVTAPQTVTISSTGPQGATGPTGATGPQGPTGATGPQGPSGVVSVVSPITNTGTSTAANIGIDQTLLSITQSQVTNLTTDLAAKAPLASPALSGTPTAPTAAVDTNTTQIATTGYVVGQGYLKSATASSTYAPLASPALTGNPTAPTATADDNDTSIATTAFVVGQAGTATPLVSGTAAAGTSLRYSRQDHVHPTDTTRATALDEVIPTDPTGAYFTGTELRLYGLSGNFVSTPDSAALDITGDIDLRVKIAPDDWTPATTMDLISKFSATGNNLSYRMRLQTDGTLAIGWSTNGTATASAASTVATGLVDGSTKWVRATLDVDNGSSGRSIQFFTSDDGSSWTQLGNTVTQAGTTSLFAGAASVEVGSSDSGVNRFTGKIYRAQILSGIGGTTVFDANFETVPADSFAFSESSSNAATVTLTTTRYSFGLPGYGLYTQSTTTPSANQTNYVPFIVRGKAITVTHLAFESTTAPASNSTYRYAIYAADNQMQPTGAPLVSGNTTVGTVNALYRIRLTPLALTAGNYVIAYNSSVATGFRSYTTANAFARNTLGASGVQARYAVTETLSANFGNPGTKWNTKDFATTTAYTVLLGWS